MNALVVDDCQDTRAQVRAALSQFQVLEADDIRSAMSIINTYPLDLVILDVGLPDGDGIELCERLTKEPKLSNVPFLIISGHGELASRLAGLHAGADDYMVKPLQSSELEARVQAILRRFRTGGVIKIDDFVFEPVKAKVSRLNPSGDKAGIDLTLTEFKVFYTLASHEGTVFSRQRLLDEIAVGHVCIEPRGIDSHVCRLREKLGDKGAQIRSVYKKGYKFESAS